MKNEDLSIFFEGIFSTTAFLDSEESPLTEINGIFDKEYLPMFDNGQATEGKQITFTVKSVEATDIHHGDELEIEGRAYSIVGIQPLDDGQITDLILKEIE